MATRPEKHAKENAEMKKNHALGGIIFQDGFATGRSAKVGLIVLSFHFQCLLACLYGNVMFRRSAGVEFLTVSSSAI